MPYYLCRVADEAGRLATRSILAPSPEDCRRLFESDGFHVLSVARDWKQALSGGISFGRKIKDRDFILFNQEFVALIRAGYPILKSLETIASRAKNVHLKEMLIRVEDDVRAGKALSEAFQPFERRFGTVYIASLLAGERSGNLPGVLARYLQYSRNVADTRSRVRSAMAYPGVVLAFSFVLVAILINFILPKFQDFYRDYEARLPAISRTLMSVALWTRVHAVYILGALVLAAVVLARMYRTEASRVRLDRARLHLPFARGLAVETGLGLFARTLSLLLEAGITLLNAVGVARQAVPNRWLRGRLAGLTDSIRNGNGLTDGLAEAAIFPPLALDMIRIGESSANLQGMLVEVADHYDDRVRTRIQTLVSLIEPVLIILMGLGVAGMLLSVYLPIFNIIKVMR